MTSSDDVQKTILRNKLLGRWAAERLGMTGRDSDAYSDTLARDTFGPARCDVFTKVRNDFNAAGVTESDQWILSVMTDLMLTAGNLMPTAQGGSADAAAVMIARNLMTR